MRRRGLTVVELLIGLIIGALALGATFKYFTSIMLTNDNVAGQGVAYQQARLAIDTMCDHLRNAQLNSNGSYVVNSVLHEAAPTTFTYYTDSSGSRVTYALSSGALQRAVSGDSPTILSNVSSLNLTYYRMVTYNGNVTSIAGTTATTAELPQIGLVKIQVGVTIGGYTANYESFVRLRNSPRKVRLSGS